MSHFSLVLRTAFAFSASLPFALAQQGPPSDNNFPAVNLPTVAKGAEVVSALGAKLPEVARWYGKSPEELRGLCEHNHHLRADKSGRLFYACEGLAVKAGTVSEAGLPAMESYPSSETFFLHSVPGATRVIYLDFNGHVTSGTSWNTNYTSGANFTTPPYDTDGSPGSFSAGELDNIQQIWKRVAEDYAPWNVDVTTQDPGLEALRRTSTSDANYGIRVCIGGSSYDWLGAGAGGVAYLGSFNWSSDTPCYVFPTQLSNGYPKYVAEAASHEAGHTVNLHHDGKNGGTQYYEGHGSWAPIMGVGYYRDLVQWSKGEYANANNTEDDTSIINSYVPRRADSAGDDVVTASSLTGSNPAIDGIIESVSDVDLYGFVTGAGTISFSAAGAAPSPNLDVRLSLFDGSGNLLASSDPAGLSSVLTASVPQGTYYIGVDGVGAGDLSTGYSEYGSLGQFALTGTLVAQSGQPPVAAASASPQSGVAPLPVAFSSSGSYDPDGSGLMYDWDFGDGSTSTATNPSKTYANVGTYTASLVVYDATGLASAPSSVVIQVTPTAVYVAQLTLSVSSAPQGYSATAQVVIKDSNGAVRSGAVVTGRWSGLTIATATATTNTSGVATFTSKRVKKRGVFTFTVDNVSLANAVYDATRNVANPVSKSTP
ncbi:MAG: PKD domain-containing protein [Verrucomicrobiales bacterium]